MKEIQSAGGPLIGLDQDHLCLWTGVFGKKFIGKDSIFSNDYEAACQARHKKNGLRENTSEIKGLAASGILINPPEYTAIIKIDQDSIYIAQIEACEPEWEFDLVSRKDFDTAQFDPEHYVYFSCKPCTYIFFDASYAGDNVVDDFLKFDLEGGRYVFSTAIYRPDGKTWLVLYKITKNENAP